MFSRLYLVQRILGDRAMINGMPVYKYIANRILTWTQNFLIWQKLSEYHTGYRDFFKEILRKTKSPGKLRRLYF
jgi:hypothetical protein